MLIGARSLGIPPRVAARLIAHCQRQDRRRRRVRMIVGGRDYSALIEGARIELGEPPTWRDWWHGPRDREGA